jgi:hypothetical protein
LAQAFATCTQHEQTLLLKWRGLQRNCLSVTVAAGFCYASKKSLDAYLRLRAAAFSAPHRHAMIFLT